MVMPAVVVVLVFGGVGCFFWGAVIRWPSDAGMVVLAVALGLGELALAYMTLWSFYAVCFTDPGSPPENEDWMSLPSYQGRPVEDPNAEEVPRLREDRVIRFCRHCRAHKPDRAHHCRQAGRCVLRMDHFCPWTGQTIGWRNQKFFVLFCCWCGALSLFTCAASALSLGLRTHFDFLVWTAGDMALAVWGFVGFVFGLTLVGFGGYHVSLVCRNMTTLEEMKRDHRWDLGSRRANVRELLGADVRSYVLPVAPRDVGSGLAFDRRRTVPEEP